MADKIPLEDIHSSNLSAIGYDPAKQILAVRFKSRDIYHYAPVSSDVVLHLYQAESKGAYYSTQIRGKYAGQKMTGPCPQCGDTGWIGERCEECGCAEYRETPRPLLHLWAESTGPTGRFKARTECNQVVDKKAIAAHADAVTCPKCQQALQAQDGAEL